MVLYLDPYHLGDPLFLTGLARDLAARGQQTRGAGVVVVHGSGERGERALEGLGRLPTSRDGVWDTEDAEGAGAVERATRDFGREVVHAINEAGVAVVRMTAGDRGLVRREDGRLEVGQHGWLADLVAQGVTVVVTTLLADGTEADAAETAGRLAAALDVPVLALSTRAGTPEQAVEGLPDRDAVRRALKTGAEVRLGARQAVRSGDTVTHAVTDV